MDFRTNINTDVYHFKQDVLAHIANVESQMSLGNLPPDTFLSDIIFLKK